MARPRAELPPPEEVFALIDEDGRLSVRVAPGARSESITIEQGSLAIKTRAKPQDGAANDAVTRMIAQALGIAPSRITLLRGATSRDKLFRLET